MRKKLILLLAVSLISFVGFSQNIDNAKLDTYFDTIVENNKITGSVVILQPDSSLIKIAHNSEETAQNTRGATKNDAYILMFLAIISAIFGGLSAWYSKKTAKNVLKQEIKRKFQKQIFEDLIRHLYRNKVCVCATRLKLENEGFDKYYPSEEHLLKLQVLPEDLRINRFDNTPQYYDELHKLELLFRNYNIEVGVALEHLKTRTLSEDVKRRDLYVLELKSGLLTKAISELMCTIMKISITDIEIEIKNKLVEEAKKTQKNNQKNPLEIEIPSRISENKNITYYDDEPLHLTEVLNEDIKGEYPKISLIAFPKTMRSTKNNS